MPRPRPTRTRVVLAEVARDRAVRATATELSQQSQVGEALLRGLIRAKLTNALRLSAIVVLGLGTLPLLFAAVPSAGEARVLGIGLPWLLLGLLAYPFLFAVGVIYVYLSERMEAEFTDLIERSDR